MAIDYGSRMPHDTIEHARNAWTRAAQVAEWVSRDAWGMINWKSLALNLAELLQQGEKWLQGMVHQWQ